MIESFKQFISEIRVLWSKIGLNQKIGLAIVLAAFVAALFFWGSYNRTDDFGLLFKNLPQKDAGEIVNVLRADGVPYRLEDNGTAILVPSDRVYELRLRLAGQGLPAEGEGWELFDKNRLGGLSDFVQQVNHTRALQAELERTISRLKQIEWARVHIVEAKDSLFVEKEEPASASVLVRTRPGERLTDGQVAGIAHLVAGAVRGLTVDNITITDHTGRQLSRPGSSDTAALASNQLEHRRQLEQLLSAKATRMLERVVGVGKAIVTVSAEIDFTSTEDRKLQYKDQITKSTSETSKEVTGPPVGGEAGAQANLGAAGAATSTISSITEERTEYMDPLLAGETRTVDPGGKIKRLAAAVFVNAGTYKTTVGPDGTETRTYEKASPAKLAAFEETVKNAIGFVDSRDSITIIDTEFTETAALPPDELKIIETNNTRQFIVSLVKSGSTAFGVLVFLLFARHVLKKTFTASPLPQPVPVPVSEARGTLDVISREEDTEAEGDEVPLKDQVQAAITEDPTRASEYLKMWMSK